jgi:hypothetical protein
VKREEELIAAGWEKRFVACGPRLSEMIEMYDEIGFEVHLEPLPSKEEMSMENCDANGCTVCFDIDRERYRIIFTRPAGNESPRGKP